MGSFPDRQILLRQSPSDGPVEAIAMIALLSFRAANIITAGQELLSLSILTLPTLAPTSARSVKRISHRPSLSPRAHAADAIQRAISQTHRARVRAIDRAVSSSNGLFSATYCMHDYEVRGGSPL